MECLESRHLLASFLWDGNPSPIPDGGDLRKTMNAAFSPPEVIQELTVFLRIEHPRLADLSVTLQGPTGTAVALALQSQLSGSDLLATFDDEASLPISVGSAPYEGRFAPTGSLGTLQGQPFAGAWTLVVTDHVAGVSGTLQAWSIDVNRPAPELTVGDVRLVGSAPGVSVAPYRPGDALAINVSWRHSNVAVFTTGLPFTVQVSVDGQTQQFEDTGYGVSGTWSNGTTFRGWEATLGFHTVEVILDPENRHWELNEEDNRFTFQFEVRDLPRAERLLDITTDSTFAYPSHLLYTGEAFYFLMSRSEQSLTAAEIWRSDGTPQGTTRIYSNRDERITELVAGESRLYFVDETLFRGKELWVSDGTAEGTRLFDPASFDSQPANLTVYRGELYFTRKRTDGLGRTLWKTDGTLVGTKLLSTELTNASRLTVANGLLYFVGSDSAYGAELWRTDGTTTGTRRLSDLRPGIDSSSPDSLTPIGDELFFTAGMPGGDRALWAATGTQVRLVADKWPGNRGLVNFLGAVEFSGAAFFGSNYQGASDRELWRSDGTAQGTDQFLNLNATASSSPRELTVVGDTLFWWANDGVHGSELWATEGSLESTRLVRDLAPGSSGSSGGGMVESHGSAIFFARQGASQIFATDGTAEGTGIAALLPLDLQTTNDLSALEPVMVGSRLYFFLSDSSQGRNLWSVTLDHLPSQLPDIHVVGASLFEAPRQFAWGDSVQLNIQFVNSGSPVAPVPASRARVYLSRDTQITTDDLLLAGSTQGELAVPQVGTSYVGVTARGDELRLPAVMPPGWSEEGVYYVGIVVDPSNEIVEVNEGNNANQGSGVDVFPIRIGRPQLVQVVTHGFRPQLVSNAEFLAPWLHDYPDELWALAQGTDLEHTMEVYTPTWDSTSGFLTAFADEILYQMFLSWSDLPQAGLLANLARALIVGEEDVSYRHAAAAAQEIFDHIQATPYLQGREFHLIGHSRGAAVNARLSRLLTSAGARIVQYTALDGYSTDWPPPSGWLGDISIVQEAVADRKVNYQVELGLKGFVDQFVLQRLSALPVSDGVRELIETRIAQPLAASERDWKAPNRSSGGMQDILIRGTVLDASDHLDVHRLYFASAQNEPAAQYILDSPLGAARLRAGESEPPPVASAAGRPLTSLVDGAFTQAGEAWELAQQLAAGDAADDPLVAAWLAVLQDSRAILESRWDVQGDVQLVDEAGNWGIRLTEGTDTQLSQWVELAPTANILTLNLTVEQPREGARLEVFFGSTVLQESDISTAVPRQTITVPLAGVAGRSGMLGVRLVGTGGTPAQVTVDNLDIHTPLTIDTLQVTPESLTSATEIRLFVPAGDEDLQTAVQIDFYLESNGLEGWQTGNGGDLPLSSAGSLLAGWSATIPPRTVAPGNHVAYAVARGPEGPGEPAWITFAVEYDDLGWQNPLDHLDVDANRSLAPRDALLVVDELNNRGPRELGRPSRLTSFPPGFLDTSGDNYVGPIDALLIINALNERTSGEGESGMFVLESIGNESSVTGTRTSTSLPDLGRMDGGRTAEGTSASSSWDDAAHADAVWADAVWAAVDEDAEYLGFGARSRWSRFARAGRNLS